LFDNHLHRKYPNSIVFLYQFWYKVNYNIPIAALIAMIVCTIILFKDFITAKQNTVTSPRFPNILTSHGHKISLW